MALNREQQEFLASLLARARTRVAAAPSVRRRSVNYFDEARSGAGPDERDPATLAGLINRFVINKGWDLSIAAGRLRSSWPTLVGTEIADHVGIESFELDPSGNSGVLVLRADSTAWATQIRLLLPTISERLDQEMGVGRVSEIKVLGPTAPSWKHGSRSVPGRGPRDTYG